MKSIMDSTWFKITVQTATILILCALIASLLILIVGESPKNVLFVFLLGAFGTPYDIGLSLFAAIPLVFTGLSVALSLENNMINIGAEGQLIMGALFAAAVGHLGPQNIALNLTLGFIAAAAGGWIWGAILGYLKAYRNSHEVVAGIMLNYLAYGLTSWITLQWLRNPHSQNPETYPIADAIKIEPYPWFQEAPVGWHIFIPLVVTLIFYLVFRYTKTGFYLRASGENIVAATFSGIPATRQIFKTLSFSGLIAGLVGFVEVYGNSGRFVVGFSPGYGFTGIAVALLGRKHPLGILLSALLFGALYKGALDLDFETEVITRDFAIILQAILILLMSCSTKHLLDRFMKRRKSHG